MDVITSQAFANISKNIEFPESLQPVVLDQLGQMTW